MFWQIFAVGPIGFDTSASPQIFEFFAFKLGESPFLGNEDLKWNYGFRIKKLSLKDDFIIELVVIRFNIKSLIFPRVHWMRAI